MLEVHCKGGPREIGRRHGKQAIKQVHGSLGFYKELFAETSKMDWTEVCKTATKFLPFLENFFDPLVEEMRGIAEGASVDFESILALNVRTEIAYGMFNDGCTAFSWKTPDSSFLAQNWDWQHEQKQNLISLYISQPLQPAIHMITEAGIIGKIGLNSAGVGVTLNAIKAVGVDFNRLPCHLALRTALNCSFRTDAVGILTTFGVASACHILIADPSGGLGLECSAVDIVKLPMSDEGIVTHTNHYLEPHHTPVGVLNSINWLPDTEFRLLRIRELLGGVKGEPTTEALEHVMQDEKNYPGSVCRGEADGTTVETLFSIIMDLKGRTANVKIGRPVRPEGFIKLVP